MKTTNHNEAKTMKVRSRFLTALFAATLMLTALPYSTLNAEQITTLHSTPNTEETSDTVKKEMKVTSPAIKVAVKGMSVNGRAATKQEKEVAKQMTKQGMRMAGKSMQLATSAIADPKRAEQLGKELEEMGAEMERMGDSLEALREDTTFFWDDNDEDSILIDQDDIDEFSDGINEDLKGWLSDTFIGKILGGSLGIMGGIFGILIALFVVGLLIVIFTAPIWILILVLWLLLRNDKKKAPRMQTRQPIMPSESNPGKNNTENNDVNVDIPNQTNEDGNSQTRYTSPVNNAYDENEEMWKNGIRQSFLGLGLIIFFLAIGFKSLWGIGAIVACIGISKLIIAWTNKKKNNNIHHVSDENSSYDK